ncbi:hypothetical protein P7K49_031001, partial [Saguinus oedipus]
AEGALGARPGGPVAGGQPRGALPNCMRQPRRAAPPGCRESPVPSRAEEELPFLCKQPGRSADLARLRPRPGRGEDCHHP